MNINLGSHFSRAPYFNSIIMLLSMPNTVENPTMVIIKKLETCSRGEVVSCSPLLLLSLSSPLLFGGGGGGGGFS